MEILGTNQDLFCSALTTVTKVSCLKLISEIMGAS